MLFREGWLAGRHGFTEVSDGVDGCIGAAEERGEGGRASGGKEAGRGGAEGGHCWVVVGSNVGHRRRYDWIVLISKKLQSLINGLEREKCGCGD